MSEDVAGATFLFATAQGHLPVILVVENYDPLPMELGEAPSTTVVPETFGVTIYTKLGLKTLTRKAAWARVASRARVHASADRTDRLYGPRRWK